MTEKRTVMFLSNVSPPLTVTTKDYPLWFLTHENYNGTAGKSKSVSEIWLIRPVFDSIFQSMC